MHKEEKPNYITLKSLHSDEERDARKSIYLFQVSINKNKVSQSSILFPSKNLKKSD